MESGNQKRMTGNTQVLYDENGNVVSIQMSHEEYAFLKKESMEHEAQNTRLQEVMRLLSSESGKMAADPVSTEPDMKEGNEESARCLGCHLCCTPSV